MPTAKGHARTQRAGRYLAQLCTHLDQLQHQTHPRSAPHPSGEPMPQIRQVQWSDTHGTVSFGHSQLTLQATRDQLIVRVQAADEANLRQTQQLLTRRIEQIGRRDRLTVTWRPADADADAAPTEHTNLVQHAAPARRRRTPIILAAAAALAIGLHIAAATALTARWTSWAAGTVLVIVAIKLAALALGGRALHHRIRHRPPHHTRRP